MIYAAARKYERKNRRARVSVSAWKRERKISVRNRCYPSGAARQNQDEKEGEALSSSVSVLLEPGWHSETLFTCWLPIKGDF